MAINPIVVYYLLTFEDDIIYVSIASSAFAASNIIGSFVLGWISDRFGRRLALLICIAGSVTGLLFQAFSANIFMLIFARAYTGFSAASTPIAFTYITQMVPQENIMTEITNLVVILWLLSTVSPAFGAGIIQLLQIIGLSEEFQYRILLIIGSLLSGIGWVPSSIFSDKGNLFSPIFISTLTFKKCFSSDLKFLFSKMKIDLICTFEKLRNQNIDFCFFIF